MCDDLTEQAVIDFAASQYIDYFITQMQVYDLCIRVIFLFNQPQQVVRGHAVELRQLDDKL